MQRRKRIERAAAELVHILHFRELAKKLILRPIVAYTLVKVADVSLDSVVLRQIIPPLHNVFKVKIVVLGRTVSLYDNKIRITAFNVLFGIAVSVVKRLYCVRRV